MGELITISDSNPLLFGGLNLIGFGGAGYYLMGQKKKAYTAWLIDALGGLCTFGLLYALVPLAAYDAYLLGQRLQLGESIDESENGLPLLDAIFR